MSLCLFFLSGSSCPYRSADLRCSSPVISLLLSGSGVHWLRPIIQTLCLLILSEAVVSTSRDDLHSALFFSF